MSGSTITGLPGALEVYASAQRTARFPTAQLISLAGAEDDGGRHQFEFITGHYFAMDGTGRLEFILTFPSSVEPMRGR